MSVGRGRERGRRAPRGAGAALAAVLLAAPAGAAAGAAGSTRNVLVLYSVSRMQPPIVEGDRGFHQAVRTTTERPVLVFDESLDGPRFGGPEYEPIVATYLREKYAQRRPDVLVAVAEPALAFLLRHRAELSPSAPVVFVGVEPGFLRSLPPLPPDVVGVPADFDFSPTIDLALRWSKARRLVFVTGTTDMDRQFEARLRVDAGRFAGRARAEFLAGLPTKEVLKRLAALGRDAAVVTPGYYRDGAGDSFLPRETVRAMAAASQAPLFGSFGTLVGTGIVGGYMPSFEAMGRQAGEVVNALLAGTRPEALALPAILPQVVNVDWRQLRRWQIPEDEVPAGAVVHFRTPTLLEEHGGKVAVALALLAIQAAGIAVLLVERRRRMSAEAVAAAQRQELSHAARLAMAGELTGSIAHEINQPLGAILSNADAAELLLDTGAGRRDELKGILDDIRRDDRRASEVVRRLRKLLSKDDAERRPVDLNDVARDVESMLAVEARRRGVRLDIRPAPAPAPTVGDRVQLHQVFVNLVMNAMDAVAEMPEERRSVALGVERRGARVAAVVRDSGPGIADGHLPRVFDPFFTTKRDGMGLGLSITRTLVESHDGRIRAGTADGGGAEFEVELPAIHAPAPGAAR